MTVYIEYAFLENFLFDGALLLLALSAARVSVRWWRICISAFFGAVFALIFPLLALPKILLITMKILVGLCMCLIAMPSLKGKKVWGRYALSCVLLFGFTFAFGGAMTAIVGRFERINSLFVSVVFAFLTVISFVLIQVLYAKKKLHAYIYECVVLYGQKRVSVAGYLDSGNLATKNGLPVCFLSADVFYDVFWEEMLCENKAKEEIAITTLSGSKSYAAFKGEIEIKTGAEKQKKVVYFALGQNIISREYKLLLHAGVLEG